MAQYHGVKVKHGLGVFANEVRPRSGVPAAAARFLPRFFAILVLFPLPAI
jgi:hypothetical protein